MEKVPQKENSKKTFALVLIVIGVLWMLKQAGAFYDFPFFSFENVFRSIGNLFDTFWGVIFSWPMILITIGIVLLAGRRSGGWILILIGAIFMLPKIIVFSGAAIFFLFPFILIGLGIALIARLF